MGRTCNRIRYPCEMATKHQRAFIPISKPYLNPRAKELLSQCIDEGWLSGDGRFVGMFEDSFSRSVDRQSGIPVCNDTSTWELALRALSIGNGDEVIFPTFTIISCASAVAHAGAGPILVDCEPGTWNVSHEKIARAVTRKTK